MLGITRKIRSKPRGKKFGDEIAESMTLGRQLFHAALELGGLNSHLDELANYRDAGLTLFEARSRVLPYLSKGLLVLETRVGRRRSIDSAKRTTQAFIEWSYSTIPQKNSA